MTSFGKFWFRYIAPEPNNPLDPSIDFSVTAEADLPQLLKVFENFLKANGYELDDRKLTLSRKPVLFNKDNLEGIDSVSGVENPWFVPYSSNDPGAAYFVSPTWGAMGEDYLSFDGVTVLGDK